MRYFIELSYKGTRYFGWQKQQSGETVQETLENGFSLVLADQVAITGCGRTDTGVHASRYFAHFDQEQDLPDGFLKRVNKVLPTDIALRRIKPMPATAHARFDATERSYTYYLHYCKDPFLTDTSWYYPYPVRPETEKLHQAAELLLQYDEFFPFCKSNSGLNHMKCTLSKAQWKQNESGDALTFEISANRFLRGMVRLIVAMCVNVATGRLELDTVRQALDKQERLIRSESAPAGGLFLSEVTYPYKI